MASLLSKAKEIEEKLKSDNDIDSIPLNEREQIYSEIEKAVESNRMTIVDDTFEFKPKRSDIKFPILLNITAFLLISSLSIFFYFTFNKAETAIVTDKVDIETAEGKLLKALVEDSQEKLKAKDREILRIQNHLLSLKQEQDNLNLQVQENSRKIEMELRNSLESDFQQERERLRNEGVSKDLIIEKMKAYESEKESEFNASLEKIRNDLESERLKKEEALKTIIEEYETDLAGISSDNKKMELLKRQQDEENLIRDQILTSYNRIKDDIKNRKTDSAGIRLTKLTEYLNSDNVKTLPSVVKRKELDKFLITTLEKLIEPNQIPESTKIIENINEKVEAADQLYKIGKVDEARTIYIDAINTLPSIEESYSKITDMDNKIIENQWNDYNKVIKSGNRYYSRENYSKSADEYTRALEVLDGDTAYPSTIVKNLINSGIEIEKERSNSTARDANLKRINTLKSKYSKSANSDSRSDDDIVSLLETKVLIKDVLSSDTVRNEYPNLHEEFQNYIDAYGRSKERMGREETIDMINNINNAIKSDRTNSLSDSNMNSEIYKYLSGLEELF